MSEANKTKNRTITKTINNNYNNKKITTTNNKKTITDRRKKRREFSPGERPTKKNTLLGASGLGSHMAVPSKVTLKEKYMFRVLTSFEVSVWKGIILFPLVAVGFNTNKFFSYKVNTWKNQHGQGFEFYLKLFGFYVEVDLSLDYEAN